MKKTALFAQVMNLFDCLHNKFLFVLCIYFLLHVCNFVCFERLCMHFWVRLGVLNRHHGVYEEPWCNSDQAAELGIEGRKMAVFIWLVDSFA